MLDEPVRYVYDFDAWHWQAKPLPKICREHFVCENSDVLWIVLELGDIVGAI